MTNSEAGPAVRHNEGASRFEADTDGGTAIVEYRRAGDRIIFTHTEVPIEARGQGIADEIAGAALEYATAERLQVVPKCRFIASYIERHPKYRPLVPARDGRDGQPGD